MIPGARPTLDVGDEAAADAKRRKVASTTTLVPGLTLASVRSRTSYRAHTEDCSSIQRSAHQLPCIPSAEGITIYPFQVQGLTGSYRVEIHADANGESFKARCSCPFSAGAGLAPQGWCKHAYAVARLLVDPVAERAELERQRRAAEELAAKQRKLLEDRAAARAQQEAQMPRQRQRVDYALSKLSATQLRDIIMDSVHSVTGLRALISLLPEDQHPGPTILHCQRCRRDYDPRYDQVCRTAHPEAEVECTYKDSKSAQYDRAACGRQFEMAHCWGYSGLCDEETGYCFVGPHDPEGEEEQEEEEGGSEEEEEEEEEESPRRRRGRNRWW